MSQLYDPADSLPLDSRKAFGITWLCQPHAIGRIMVGGMFNVRCGGKYFSMIWTDGKSPLCSSIGLSPNHAEWPIGLSTLSGPCRIYFVTRDSKHALRNVGLLAVATCQTLPPSAPVECATSHGYRPSIHICHSCAMLRFTLHPPCA